MYNLMKIQRLPWRLEYFVYNILINLNSFRFLFPDLKTQNIQCTFINEIE